ncbi:hypothetical protein FJZ33_00365 [Candidatus Poribacteria bacterium]|nr:hypothetical protein [Candidatus Poribacteria bacterium]
MKGLIATRVLCLVLYSIMIWILVLGCGENNPPVLDRKVEITPVPPVYAGQLISLQASANDEDEDKIEYMWSAVNSKGMDVTDEVFVGGERSGFSVNFKADIPDTYVITVIARNSEGSDSFSFPLVVLAGDKPVVSILSPKAGTVQGMVNITVKADDDKGVTKVEFYIDGILVAERDSFPFSYSWDTTGISGNHVIEAKAYDSDGNQGNSEPVLITVQNISAAKVKITEPADGGLVDRKTTVKGTCEGLPEGYHLWVFVNPHTVGMWYPQPAPSLRIVGGVLNWQALCYFGREGEDQGVEFDIAVIQMDDEKAKNLAEEVEAGDPPPRFLFDPILALITVKRK